MSISALMLSKRRPVDIRESRKPYSPEEGFVFWYNFCP